MTSAARSAILAPILMLAATACGAGATSGTTPQPIGQPGLGTTPSRVAGKDCGQVTREGAPATGSQVVEGCTVSGKAIALRTQRCKDGRTYMIYGTTAKGMIGGVWHDVGPGHEAAAKRFASC